MTRTPLSRRTALALTAAVVVGFATACSSSDEPVSTDAASSAVSGNAFPVTIDHKFGATTIEDEPERVVTVGWNDQDFVLALGVVPVSTREWYEDYSSFPWVQSALGGAQLAATIPGDGISLERVAEQKPDVIFAIYESIDQDTYDRLSEIAPTIVQSAEYEDERTPWDVQTLTTGAALGRTEQAQALVADVQGRIDDAKAAHPRFATSVLVEGFGDDGKYLIGAGDPRRALFDALGFPAQEEVGDTSDERLDIVNRDVLFVNGRTRDEMLANPVFAQLPVVTEGRTLYAGGRSALSGALAYSGPGALLYALDATVPQLAAAVDGNPSTVVADLPGG